MSFNIVAVYFLVAVFLSYVNSQLEVIPERAGIYNVNPKYVSYGKYFVNRYNRKSIYYANLEGDILCEWNNNVSVEAVFYEKLGNVYKRSFMEMKYRLCDLINKDDVLGPTIRAAGVTCPMPKGVFRLMNMTLKKAVFPYKMPFERARVDGTFMVTSTREEIASGYLYLSFQQRRQAKTMQDKQKKTFV